MGKVHDRADLLEIQEQRPADDGRAGPHVTATYGTREDQDVCVALFRAHRSIILKLRNHPKRPYPLAVCTVGGIVRDYEDNVAQRALDARYVSVSRRARKKSNRTLSAASAGTAKITPKNPTISPPAITAKKIRIEGTCKALPCIRGCNTLPSSC